MDDILNSTVISHLSIQEQQTCVFIYPEARYFYARSCETKCKILFELSAVK